MVVKTKQEIKRSFISKYGRFSEETATEIGLWLQDFIDAEYGLDFQAIFAKIEDSPLAEHLQWDDEIAAEQWRQDQVRKIVWNLQLKIVYDDDSTRTIRAFPNRKFSYETESGEIIVKRRYLAPKSMNYEDHRQALIQEALDRFRSYRKTYAELKELNEIFEAIDNFEI